MALNKIKINDTTTVNTGVVYDITKATSQSYDTLSAALGTDGNNVPPEVREGGMSIRFVSNSDNKYVQYRLMANTFSTDEDDWQGVDDVPTAGSDNLVKSGGVADKISELEKKTTEINEYTKNPDYKKVLLDSKGNIAEGIDSNDIDHSYLETIFHNDIYTKRNLFTKSLFTGNTSIEEVSHIKFAHVTIDKKGKVIKAIDKNGDIIIGGNLLVQGDISGVSKNNEFKNKKIVYIGDSITYGDTLGRDRLTSRWSTLVTNMLDAIEINLGQNGTCVEKITNKTNSFIERVDENSSVIADASLVVVFGGTNDFVITENPLGNVYTEELVPDDYKPGYVGSVYRKPTENEYTFDGAYNVLIKKIRNYAPSARILLITPMHRKYTYVSGMGYIPSGISKNARGNYMQDFVDVIRKIADYYGFPIVDLWRDSNMNTLYSGIDSKYFTDGTHPNIEGHRVLANIIYNKIIQLFF